MKSLRIDYRFLKNQIGLALLACVYGFLFLGLYRASTDYLLDSWNGGDYSYAYLIPFVVLYLVWEKRHLLKTVPVGNAWWGIVPLVFGIAFFWLGELGGEYYTLYVSGWLILVGILWMHFGRQKLKVMAFPVFLILTTIPFPAFLIFRISLDLQLISSRLAVALLRMIGIVAHRQGNVIDIGYTQIQVVDACSGLRYVFPLLVLGLIVAYFFRSQLWKRAGLVLSTIPITILLNSVRIALTGVLWIQWGPKAAEGTLHDFSGFVIFLVSIMVLLAEMWVLSKIGPPRTLHEGLPKADSSCPAERPESKGTITDERNFQTGSPGADSSYIFLGAPLPKHLLRAVPVVVLLGLNLFCLKNVDFRQRIPIRETLSKFPLDIAEWHGARQHLDPGLLRYLGLNDYTMIDYRNKAGQNIDLYVAYLETQVKGLSMHSPETCFPGNGWILKDYATSTIPVKFGDGNLKVNRILSEKFGKKMLAYFWFPQRGRILTTIFQLKLYNFWDALTQQRTDGALVRVTTPLSGTESIENAESRLNEFLSRILPILDPFIPGREIQPAGRFSQMRTSVTR